MLKLNDGGKQESEVARPFVVLLWCGIGIGGGIGGGGIGIGIVVGKGGCKVREGKRA